MNTGKTLFAQVMEFVPWTSFTHQESSQTVCQRGSWLRAQQHRLGIRRNHHRSILECVRLGAISYSQSSRQTTHIVRPQGLNSCLYTHLRREDARSQCTTYTHLRARRILCEGPGLHRLSMPIQASSKWFLLWTRAKSNPDARRVYSQAVDKDKGVIYDQAIMLNGFYKAQEYPERLRKVKYRNPKTDQVLIFLTNNTSLPALAIAALYKSR